MTKEELAFDNVLCERGDLIENAAHRFLCEITEKELEWNIGLIRQVADAAIEAMEDNRIHICDPGCFEDEGKPCYKYEKCPFLYEAEKCPMKEFRDKKE